MRASTILRFVAIATITAAIVAAIPAAARAQTITACSANKSGSMYRVGTTGTPADCTNTSHKKETWNVQGPQGPQGVQGPQGAPGLSGIEVKKYMALVQPTKSLGVGVGCSTGKVVLGGGFNLSNSTDRRLWSSQPTTTDGVSYTGWMVVADNLSTTYPLAVEVYVICAKAAP